MPDSSFKAMTALLVKDHLTPEQGLCLMDSLDENAYKHAFAVSEDLKFALRECVELLGNEAINQLAADYIQRKESCKLFSAEQIQQLQTFSAKIDELWQAHTREQARIREKTTDPFNIWGQPEDLQLE